MTTDATFSGLPINGNITYGIEPKDQRPADDLTPILQAALDQPGVTEITWAQYTPYFNDGDPCVFGANLRSLDVDGKSVEFPPYRDEDRAVVGYREPAHRGGNYDGPDAHRYDAFQALSNAIDNGEFDTALLKLFGDHAMVSVRKGDGIFVEFYEHD